MPDRFFFNINMLLFILLTNFCRADAQTISKIWMEPINVIYVVDTAKTNDEISSKMGKNYSRLFTIVAQQHLKPGRVMAIYHTSSPPWIFDIALEVTAAPGRQTDGIQFKSIEGGDAIVLHYKGPYEQIGKAYQQIDMWLKDNNKKSSGQPIEIYLNQLATVKDKAELLTDICQLIK